MSEGQAGWFRLQRIPRSVGDAFTYGPLTSAPLIAAVVVAWYFLATIQSPRAFEGVSVPLDVLAFVGVSLLYGIPLTYAAMVIFGIPAVLTFLRFGVRSGPTWIAAGAASGLVVGIVLPVPIWLGFTPVMLVYPALGLFVGGWNAYLLWRANERAVEQGE